MPPTLAEAAHLVSSSAAYGSLRAAGAPWRRIHRTDDRLTSGPCDVDPIRHEALRRAWDTEGWRRPLGLDDLRALIAGDDPVVLWATHAFSDLVLLWWALDGLRRIGAEGSRLFLARPRPADSEETVGGATPEELRLALAGARPITPDEWSEGADLWIKLASPSPLAFDEARRAGSAAFPELTSSAELHGAWFPRRTRGGLQLSEIDEDLLASLDDSSLSVSELARRFDPFIAIYRLRAWAQLGVVEHEEVVDQNPWVRDRFRATARSRALLEHGLDNVSDAPQLHVGGCVVNDPASPWTRIEDAGGWRLALDVRS